MAASAFLETSLHTYFHTSYRPDCDWIDGELRARNVGQFDHANLQKVLIMYLSAREKQWNLRVLPEQRVKVTDRRYRVPDIVVVARDQREPIVTQPPLVCIEILSPEDTVSDLEDRLLDYLAMGVPGIWVFDPAKRRAWEIKHQGTWVAASNAEDTHITCGVVEVNLTEVFKSAAE